MSEKTIYTCDICGRDDDSKSFLQILTAPQHKRTGDGVANMPVDSAIYMACPWCRGGVGALVENLKLCKKQVAEPAK